VVFPSFPRKKSLIFHTFQGDFYLHIHSNQSKPICNAPISPSKKPESEAREATVTGSDQALKQESKVLNKTDVKVNATNLRLLLVASCCITCRISLQALVQFSGWPKMEITCKHSTAHATNLTSHFDAASLQHTQPD